MQGGQGGRGSGEWKARQGAAREGGGGGRGGEPGGGAARRHDILAGTAPGEEARVLLRGARAGRRSRPCGEHVKQIDSAGSTGAVRRGGRHRKVKVLHTRVTQTARRQCAQRGDAEARLGGAVAGRWRRMGAGTDTDAVPSCSAERLAAAPCRQCGARRGASARLRPPRRARRTHPHARAATQWASRIPHPGIALCAAFRSAIT